MKKKIMTAMAETPNKAVCFRGSENNFGLEEKVLSKESPIQFKFINVELNSRKPQLGQLAFNSSHM